MRNWLHKIVFIFSCLIAAGQAVAANEQDSHKTITLSAISGPPFLSEHADNGGLIPKLVTEAYLLEGYKVVIEWLPAKRSVIQTIKGDFDGFMVSAMVPPHNAQLFFSDPFIKDDLVLFSLKSKQFDWKTIDDLYGLTLGMRYSMSSAGDVFRSTVEQNKIHIKQSLNFKHSFNQLLAKKVDLVVTFKNVGLHLLKIDFNDDVISQIDFHPKPVNTPVYRLAFSKAVNNIQEKIDAFNRGLKKLRASGRYQELFQEAGLTDSMILLPPETKNKIKLNNEKI